MSRFVLVILCLQTVYRIETARILAVFPTPSISHQVVFRPLTQELARRGHEVLVITTDPAFPKGQTPANFTEIDVHDISYKLWRDNVLSSASSTENDPNAQVKVMLNMFVEIYKQQILTDEVQSVLKYTGQHFDLLLLEACIRPALSFSHVFKAPVVLVSSLGAISGDYEFLGAPTNPPLLYPTVTHRRLYNLTLWEKITELYDHYQVESLMSDHEAQVNVMLRDLFGPDIPTVYELMNNVHMWFYNVHPIWEGNRPVPPSVVYMGGLHQKPLKELPQDLKTFLDSSVNGVIYISFGTNVSPSLLPTEKIQKLVRVLSELPYDVLFKWDKDVLPGKWKNIKILKWLPQSDLLNHPNVKLFITQGGLQSTDEAISAGVPLIGMPMLADQWYNVEKYAHHKIGLRYDMETLDEDTLTKAINTVIVNESYRRNVAKLRDLMFDQPQRPLERAVWWTEHVLRHGGARHLRAPAAKMSWSEYLDLELVSVLLTTSLIVITIFFTIIRLLLSCINRNINYGKIKVS